MDNYDMELIRHHVGKALKETDEIDCTEMDREDIELALWAATGEISNGMYMTHPSTHDEYKYHTKAEKHRDEI
jgi:hypothetical protein